MKRVEGASGANYSAHKEQPRKFEPIAPVGTNYTPVGAVDLNELRRSARPVSVKVTKLRGNAQSMVGTEFSICHSSCP